MSEAYYFPHVVMFQEASFEYLQNEGERTLLEAMDSLEVAFSNQNIRPVRGAAGVCSATVSAAGVCSATVSAAGVCSATVSAAGISSATVSAAGVSSATVSAAGISSATVFLAAGVCSATVSAAGVSSATILATISVLLIPENLK